MKLKAWLDRENLTFAEFAGRIDRTAESVRRYASSERIPDRDTMPKIVAETGGEVTANDFFDIGEPPAGADPSAVGEAASPDMVPPTIGGPVLVDAGTFTDPAAPNDRCPSGRTPPAPCDKAGGARQPAAAAAHPLAGDAAVAGDGLAEAAE